MLKFNIWTFLVFEGILAKNLKIFAENPEIAVCKSPVGEINCNEKLMKNSEFVILMTVKIRNLSSNSSINIQVIKWALF